MPTPTFLNSVPWGSELLTARSHLHDAFLLLWEGVTYACDLGTDRWQFSVEIAALHEIGVTNNDLRWLLSKGLAQQALEITPSASSVRTFRSLAGLTLAEGACFALTERGVSFIRQVFLNAPGTTEVAASVIGDINQEVVAGAQPIWDAARKELSVGGTVVKQFKLPAPNQEALLAAFQEEAWPPRIDDPLPARLLLDPKQRLHDTIKSLNRHQRIPLVHFKGDGSGEGVLWELVAPLPGLPDAKPATRTLA